MNAHQIQVVIDSANPAKLAEFWAEVMGYVVEPPPPGFDSWEAFAERVGIPENEWDRLSAVVDPDREGPRILFQKVPEPKTVKNRVHLDVDAAPGTARGSAERRTGVRRRADELTTRGARMLREVDEPAGWCLVMADPEGNEFCLH
jgi:Glyoxalase-like domain